MRKAKNSGREKTRKQSQKMQKEGGNKNKNKIYEIESKHKIESINLTAGFLNDK